MQIFVNEFLTLGMKSYFEKSDSYPFERHIIGLLSLIYGEEELKEIYAKNDTIAFHNLLLKYGLKESIYANFLQNTQKYSDYQRRKKDKRYERTSILCSIEADIINMFLFKYLNTNPSEQEKEDFEKLLLNNDKIKTLHRECSINPEATFKRWQQKSKMLVSTVRLEEIKPQFLKDEDYLRYGVRIDEVKKMDPRMIKKLNSYIEDRIKDDQTRRISMTRKEKLKEIGNTYLSSGNGYVDLLMVISIIATELSLGLIYIFLHMGG